MNREVTIVITTWNSLDFLKLCMGALKKYTEQPYSVIILDNGSVDGTREYVSSLNDKTIKYLRSERNLGTIRALKRAEKWIKTKFVVLLDSDSIVSPGWLEIFLDIYENNPQVKAIGPAKPSSQLAYPYRKDRNSREVWDEIERKFDGEKPERLLREYCDGRNYEQFAEDFLNMNDGEDKMLQCPPELLSGCCTFLDYDFIKPLGGLTRIAFKKYGVDDVDRCWRVSKGGGLVIKTNRVYVHHFEGSSLKKNKLNYRTLLYENNRILIDLWSKELWKFIEASDLSLGELAGKYWLVRELLLSARENQIPKKFKSELKDLTLVSSV